MGFSDVMKKVFPFISAAASIGGPLGTMAAMAIGNALGVKDVKNDASSITDVIAAAMGNPEQRAALIKAEHDFQLQMAELGYKNASDLEAIAANDRASARTMQTATRSKIPAILGLCVTVGFFGLLVITAFHAPPADSAKVLDVMTGSLGTAWIMVITFYFGSSSGSERKTEIMAQGGKP